MDLLKMLVVPLVLVSIIRVIMNMNKDENLGKLNIKNNIYVIRNNCYSSNNRINSRKFI